MLSKYIFSHIQDRHLKATAPAPLAGQRRSRGFSQCAQWTFPLTPSCSAYQADTAAAAGMAAPGYNTHDSMDRPKVSAHTQEVGAAGSTSTLRKCPERISCGRTADLLHATCHNGHVTQASHAGVHCYCTTRHLSFRPPH